MFKPMLAVAAEMSKIVYPVIASPKLDGIRCSIVNGVAKTRTLKNIPNKHVAAWLSVDVFDGLDGELIVGSPTSPSVYRDTVSEVMSHDKIPDFKFYVFDVHNMNAPYHERLGYIADCHAHRQLGLLQIHEAVHIPNETELLEYEAACIEAGYEGLIVRAPNSPYKFGRSTVNEGYMLKVKRFEDSEAEIIGFEEEMFNGNEAETNELGRTKRSTAKAGLTGKNTLGAFQVRDVYSGVEFSIGTGLTANDRLSAWASRTVLAGKIVKYKFFPVGVKDAPRHPVFLGFRSAIDM